MRITNRIKDIIKALLESQNYIKVKDISNQLNISERTVYREIPEASDILRDYGIELVTVSKKGMKLKGSPEDIEKCRFDICEKSKLQVVDKKERFYTILMELLRQEDYMKTEALSIDLGVSLSTIRNDLKVFQEKFPEESIMLKTKKGEGIFLEGSVFVKDHLFIYCILQNMDIGMLEQWLTKELDTYNLFLHTFEKVYNMDIVRRCHTLIQDYIYTDQKSYEIQLDDYDYVEIVLMTALYVQRKMEGITTYFSENFYEKDEIQEHFIKELTRMLSREFSITIEQTESNYIGCMWKRRVNILMFRDQNGQADSSLRKSTMKLIESIENQLGIDLKQDTNLTDGLTTHIGKALERVRSGMSISNPFIQDTKKDYGQIFKIVKNSVQDVFPDDYFPEDEIGYIVLYFAVSMDRITQKSFRVMVVCSSGMGSAKMLASRLEREIPELYIKKVTSFITMQKEDLTDYDLVLSTVPINLKTIDCLKVSPLLTQEDLILVQEKIKRHKYKILKKINRAQAALKENHYVAMRNAYQLMEWSLDIIDHFRIYEVGELGYEKDFVINQLNTLKSMGVELSGQELEDYMSEKGNVGRFVIPLTQICYSECYLKSISKPIMFMYRLKTKQKFMDMPWLVSHIICFFYPSDLNQLQERFLRNFSSQIIEDGDILKTIEAGEASEIQQIFASRLRKYIRELL